jgi:hypothetical protein
MKKPKTNRKRPAVESKPPPRRVLLGMAAGLSVGLILLLYFWWHRSPTAETQVQTSDSSTHTIASVQAASSDPYKLRGRWLRPDGGYVIDIRRVQEDGLVEAAYFNPQPIHVARADWRRETNGINLFVELRDVNYPGATYNLRYQSALDQLTGEYYQPIYQQTFEVQFVRQE